LAVELESIARSCLGGESSVVKTLGDGILLTDPAPLSALKLAVCILEGLHDLGMGVDARCGAHHGTVVWRGGDLYGSTVNLAARLAPMAQPGHIVVTRTLAEVATDLELAAAPLGERAVKGFIELVELFELSLCGHYDKWIADPVCGMRLRSEDAVEPRLHDGRLIGFCSARCVELFEEDPTRFAY
jgi:adenylate cyclase